MESVYKEIQVKKKHTYQLISHEDGPHAVVGNSPVGHHSGTPDSPIIIANR